MRFQNQIVDYNHSLFPEKAREFTKDTILMMHAFWSGTISEKHICSIKSVFASQTKYKYRMILWHDGNFNIEKPVQQEFYELCEKNKNRFEVHKFDFNSFQDELTKSLIGCFNINTMTPVEKSDLIRILLLYRYGGLWFDLDFIFLRDFSPLLSYGNFIFPWGFYKYSANGMICIDSSKNKVITQIVNKCIEKKSCHSTKVFLNEIEYDGLNVLPCYVVYPEWMGCVKNVPIHGFKNCYDIFQECKSKIDYRSLFPCSYAFHWHNRWEHEIDDSSVFRQIKSQIDDILLNGHSNENSLNLVIFDSTDIAGDNGEFLYRRIRQLDPTTKMTFLLSSNSKDCNRLKKDGFNLVDCNNSVVLQLFKNATYILWSKTVGKYQSILSQYRNKSIFLGHGVTSLISNDDFYFINCLNKQAKYICCTSKDEMNVINSYSRHGITPLLVGFPRHDVLLEKNEKNKSTNSNKKVFISFHWRRGGIDSNESQFKSSQYLFQINNLLSDKRLNEFVNSGVEVVFYPHARFRKYLRNFTIPSYIKVGSDKTFQDLLVESDVLITDFSSNSFEMAYMGKKTIHFVPDMQYVKNNMKQYHIENVQKYPHMVVCNDVNSVFENLNNLLESNSYDELKSMFAYHDQNNSQRLLDKLIEIKYSNKVPVQKSSLDTVQIKNAQANKHAPSGQIKCVQRTKEKSKVVHTTPHSSIQKKHSGTFAFGFH